MECFVYFLYSDSCKQFYVGISNDIEKRLKRHNNRESLSTKKGVPWVVVHVIACINKSAATKLESKIKKRGIRRYLADQNIVHRY
jgi:putative endonuclease